MKRPEASFAALRNEVQFRDGDLELLNQANIEIKYEGYILKQTREIDKILKMNQKNIPNTIDFDKIGGLKVESREKFKKYRPKTFLDAQKIAGINPADLGVLIAYLNK